LEVLLLRPEIWSQLCGQIRDEHGITRWRNAQRARDKPSPLT
jgi:hypothetical protein